MNRINFPLTIDFHVGTFANDLTITDTYKNILFYARQKMLKLTMETEVFSDSQKNKLALQY